MSALQLIILGRILGCLQPLLVIGQMSGSDFYGIFAGLQILKVERKTDDSAVIADRYFGLLKSEIFFFAVKDTGTVTVQSIQNLPVYL